MMIVLNNSNSVLPIVKVLVMGIDANSLLIIKLSTVNDNRVIKKIDHKM